MQQDMHINHLQHTAMMVSLLFLIHSARAMVSVGRDYNVDRGLIIGQPYYFQKNESDSGRREDLASESESAQPPDDVFIPYGAERYRAAPERFNRSISQGKFKANPNNFRAILMQEFDDISKELRNRLMGQIEHVQDAGYDKLRFKQVFVIRKHIVSDGKKKVVNISVKEHIVPRDAFASDADSSGGDMGTYALLGCILFLLAGLVFTTTIKMYQNIIRKGYIRGKAGDPAQLQL